MTLTLDQAGKDDGNIIILTIACHDDPGDADVGRV